MISEGRTMADSLSREFARAEMLHSWRQNLLPLRTDRHLHESNGKGLTNFDRVDATARWDSAQAEVLLPYEAVAEKCNESCGLRLKPLFHRPDSGWIEGLDGNGIGLTDTWGATDNSGGRLFHGFHGSYAISCRCRRSKCQSETSPIASFPGCYCITSLFFGASLQASYKEPYD